MRVLFVCTLCIYAVLGDDIKLSQQRDVLDLFKYMHQRTSLKKHVDIANTFSIKANIDKYTHPELVDEFLKLYEYGLLPMDEIYGLFYEEHLEEAAALFKVFYFAKDFDTFYKSACWARFNVNQGVFLYALSIALQNRADTFDMVLPPIYEVNPYYFFNTEVIQKAQRYKQVGRPLPEFHFQANYSGWYMNVHPEQAMSYFTEDVGIAAYYYFYNLYRPCWMNIEELGVNTYKRGEQYYYFYQQLIARYYLERLSNHLGEIGSYDYEDAFETGYFPSMTYPNGVQFPQRPNWAKFFMNYYNHGQSFSTKGPYPYAYNRVMDYERRIRDAIDLGFVITEDGKQVGIYTPDGFNTLADILEANPQAINSQYYGHLLVYARHLIGYTFQALGPYKTVPSALENFETSMRDPGFWQLYKRLIIHFQKYKRNLEPYARGYLQFAGVKVEGISVDPLVTFFDNFDVDISNAVYVNDDEFQGNDFDIHVRQFRLNHKPFSYRINVSSAENVEGVLRVFIGPKWDEYGRFIELEENRLNFVEIDRFRYKLASGANVVVRNSEDLLFNDDRVSFRKMYEKVQVAEKPHAFPKRFLLPKGRASGQTFYMYVIVSPYKPLVLEKDAVVPIVGLGVERHDDFDLGFPFDRPIDKTAFYVENSYFQNVMINHEGDDTIYGLTRSYDQLAAADSKKKKGEVAKVQLSYVQSPASKFDELYLKFRSSSMYVPQSVRF
ncbi:lantern octopamine-binding secreted hemocyanina [Photinus pyralis]|uniref:Lantern octopamine-binding secreted hemocyanina n=1 Tax=Photinus pyralis TaxID=7054 RepID=A0A1Y1LP40_PHOPY|nr:arylphorin subunit alpha-like [Photinus pyralis]KAB0790879.1 lantern octopamine-binding secreted hemocyanina [Photinus pyralis]